MPERTFIVELTAEELSATIEAYNVVDAVVEGRPPLKDGPVQRFAGENGRLYRHVGRAGRAAWKKFIDAEGGRA